MNKIILTAGYLPGDDELTEMKGHRSDVLVEDENGKLYELNFITPERLKVELEANVSDGKNYFADRGLICLEEVNLPSIIDAVKGLLRDRYLDSLNHVEEVRNESWYEVLIEDVP